MNPKPAQLVQGIDYTIENGLLVFTAAYHLKRGTCCQSGCRKCPYGRAPKPPETEAGKR